MQKYTLIYWIIIVFLLVGCSNNQIIIDENPNPFIRATTEQILNNPGEYENKQVVILSKKQDLYWGTAPFRSRTYNYYSNNIVENSSFYNIYTLDDTIIIGNSSKLIVYDYNKMWSLLSRDVETDPYWMKQKQYLTDKFYNDVYFDFYGVVELHPVCTCEHYAYGFIESYDLHTKELEKYGEIKTKCDDSIGRAEICNGLWRYEDDIIAQDCYDYFDKKSKENMEVYISEGDGGGRNYKGFAHKISESTSLYFFNPDGSRRDNNQRIIDYEGNKYFFPTYSCKEGSTRMMPLLRFVDSKIKYSETDSWKLEQVGCYDLQEPKGSGRPMKKCINREYLILE